jgi:hypothetical protein
MTDDVKDDHAATSVDASFEELEIVAYVGDFKVVGCAHFGVGQRASSRRASDFIRAFQDNRLTLSSVKVYQRMGGELVDSAPFVILNLDKVDLIYAREEQAPDAEPDPAPQA